MNPKQMALGGVLLLGIGAAVVRSIPDGSGSAQPASAAAEIVNPDSDAAAGRVLPFNIIGAIRNLGFQGGMVAAQVSVSVDGGVPADWMATATYLAEHSIVNGVIFSQVEVYIPSPWGDMPPTHSKALAKAYYAPEPSRSPWKEKWSIFTAERRGTLADVEYDKLNSDLMDKYSDRISDPDKLSIKAEADARKIVIGKYKLPARWQPAINLGLTGTEYGRAHIRIVGSDGTEASMSALARCLNSNQGTIFKGCQADRSGN
jgi:hypothetical protein